MPPTFVESVVARHACGTPRKRSPRPGDLVWLRPSLLMTHDNTSAVLARFRSMGAQRVAHPERCLVVLDHDVQNTSRSNLAKYASIEAFAREQGIEFHGAGSGIGHQIVIERRLARPGELCVAADSHANMYGAVGALGVAVSRSDAAGIWAAGMFWWEVPPTVRVVLEGRLPDGATGKDVALVLCALYPDDVLGHAVEFQGPAAEILEIDDRLTISNMTTEWGAVAGVFPKEIDAGASYAKTITLDLAAVSPHVSGPDTLASAVPVSALAKERIAIQKAYLVSCANGRMSDFDAAARALDGRRIASGVSMFMAAASARVQQDTETNGSWRVLLDAGAVPLPSGCGPCIGLGAGLLAPGETGISASNRNFKGRMGSPEARCYLASPAVVAASAAAGYICGPDTAAASTPERRITVHTLPAAQSTEAPQSGAHGAPGAVMGRLVVFLRDGIDSDALCPASLVYDDGASKEQLARALLGSIDPAFACAVRHGDVLVAGARFGIGSSREQAVSALAAAGIKAVIAESLAPTFRRNAWNNGFLAIERPELVQSLRDRYPEATRAAVFTDESVTVERAWLPRVAQDLIAAGGLNAFLKAQPADA